MFDRSLSAKLRALPWRKDAPFAVMLWVYLAAALFVAAIAGGLA